VLYKEGASSVVRLSDALKLALGTLAGMTAEAIEWFDSHTEAIEEMKRRGASGDFENDDSGGNTSLAIAQQGMFRQSRIHSQALTTVLLAAFLLESYINSLAHFVLTERDLLGLVRDGKRSSAEVLYEAIERMKVRDKWGAVARLNTDAKFDKSRSPWQDFDILFKFRDDHVHDKVLQYSELGANRYRGRLPDKIGGLLTLGHAVFAAETYWGMVKAVHELVGVTMAEFHRHYNLSPWPGEADLLRKLAERYDEKF